MVRIFSVKRIALSVVLGFLMPLSYAFGLSAMSDHTGKAAPEFMVMPFGWAISLWFLLLGRQPEEGDLLPGILFLAFCNIALYGTLSYAVLTVLSLRRRKQVEYELPPSPEQKYT